MRIPYGATFTASAALPVVDTHTCPHCQAATPMRVVAGAEGSATAFLWIGMKSALARAERNAEKNAASLGKSQIALARCPACNLRSAPAVTRFHLVTVAVALLILGVFGAGVVWATGLESILALALPILGGLIGALFLGGFLLGRRATLRASDAAVAIGAPEGGAAAATASAQG
ncbi:MAG: hypothetical protein KC635_21255 [Myxococcales bacterium]|nr:hypothetical protein [Myxococcales bacterium]MCB9732785.1 hypothetical protein [Deltaproteobacteria bacterium]